MKIPDPGEVARWVFLVALQIGVMLFGLAFAIWAFKMFLRALSY